LRFGRAARFATFLGTSGFVRPLLDSRSCSKTSPATSVWSKR
jgi:hypothetical protein